MFFFSTTFIKMTLTSDLDLAQNEASRSGLCTREGLVVGGALSCVPVACRHEEVSSVGIEGNGDGGNGN